VRGRWKYADGEGIDPRRLRFYTMQSAASVLNSAGSEFHGFITDQYTTLAETTDRILSTSLNVRWRHGGLLEAGEWDALNEAVTQSLEDHFSSNQPAVIAEAAAPWPTTWSIFCAGRCLAGGRRERAKSSRRRAARFLDRR